VENNSFCKIPNRVSKKKGYLMSRLESPDSILRVIFMLV